MSGSTIGIYVVLPPFVFEKKPTPPEMSGVSCALTHVGPPARSKRTTIVRVAVVNGKKCNVGIRIRKRLAKHQFECVSCSSAVCQLIVMPPLLQNAHRR